MFNVHVVEEIYGFFFKGYTERLLHISLMLYTFAVWNYAAQLSNKNKLM